MHSREAEKQRNHYLSHFKTSMLTITPLMWSHEKRRKIILYEYMLCFTKFWKDTKDRKYCVYIWHYKLQIKLLALKINLLYLNKIIPILTLCLSSCLCVISIELTLRALWDISLKDVCNNHFSLSCWASWKSKWSWYALSNFATIS